MLIRTGAKIALEIYRNWAEKALKLPSLQFEQMDHKICLEICHLSSDTFLLSHEPIRNKFERIFCKTPLHLNAYNCN